MACIRCGNVMELIDVSKNLYRCPRCDWMNKKPTVQKPQPQEVVVEAEQIAVRVGNLTIETPPALGNVTPAYATKVLFDGQPPPLMVSRIELVCDAEDGVWRVTLAKISGFVSNRAAPDAAESWRDRSPQL